MLARRCFAMIIFLIASSVVAFASLEANACTALMAGKKATLDGSVLMAWSNGSSSMSWLEINPSTTFELGKQIPMLSNRPINEKTLNLYHEQLRKSYNNVGYLTVPEDIPEVTYHYFIGRSHHMENCSVGFNQHGVAIATAYMPMRDVLFSKHGALATAPDPLTMSMAEIALMQSKTAREAIRVMGSLAERHGLLNYFDEKVGLSLPIVDKEEAWIMEIFPGGPDWTPDIDEPGAVWAAKRIPDDGFFVHANRSRIEEIDLDDNEHLIVSPNVHSLSKKLGLWNPDEKFVWRKIYGQPGEAWNCLSEWASYDAIAPSKKFQYTGDAKKDRYPFSVTPDKPIRVQDFIVIMRNQFEGMKWDITLDPAFQVKREKSLLGRTHGRKALLELVPELKDRTVFPKRSIGTDTTTQWLVVHNRSWLPDLVSSAIWCSLGPTHTSVLAPLYPVVTELPLSWTSKLPLYRINRDHAAWNFHLVYNLMYLKEQEVFEDLKKVIQPAEEHFFTVQQDFENEVMLIYRKQGEKAAVEMLTEYSYFWFNQIHNTYYDLVDFLLCKYVLQCPELARPRLPQIVPYIPGRSLDGRCH